MTNHTNCSHPKTKAARAACRAAMTKHREETALAVHGDILSAVKTHAVANYTNDGWDVVVEAMTDDEITAVIGNARTLKTAIARVAAHVAPIEI